MTTAPRLSVCLVTFESDREILLRCVDDVLRSGGVLGGGVEVVVVDNASRAVPLPVEELGARGVRVVRRGDNGGFAVAANVAVAQARGQHVLLLNPDTRISPEGLSALVRAAAEHGRALYCGWLLKAGDVQVDAFMSWWWSTERLARRASYRRRLRSSAQKGGVVLVQKVSGGALFAERDLLVDLGPFDEDFFLYGEDVDLSLRARARGLPLLAVPEAVVHHLGGGSSKVVSSALVERARVDAALRLHVHHRSYLGGLLARAELLVVTAIGLLAVRATSSRDGAGRRARLAELRRWGVRRRVASFVPRVEATC